MIVVTYLEEQIDPATGAITHVPLGSESHRDIDEVLLPGVPRPNDPIFFTKKFAGHDAYRWEVLQVVEDIAAAERTYVVTLRWRDQIPKQFYLKNILAARRDTARHVLHPWSIVEVEFGHPMLVGKENGDIRSTKRYVDTIQSLSMPKRRLAVVIQVHRGRDELVQVIPISSRAPTGTDNSMVEVTTALSNMAYYQKPSWAVCKMIQTVTASRIIAPTVRIAPTKLVRDTVFRNKISGTLRDDLKAAILYGVAADGAVAALQAQPGEQAKIKQQDQQLIEQAQELISLKSELWFYEQLAAMEKMTLSDLQDMFSDKSPAPAA
ncbi:MAG: type II toxin-antitoxin system PemK/MazF family toxin [Burkholderiaceae bacterium]|nr:type II toxin-antitoxin system PemK/MazF family toxin [Burkholderiaceae bacterium]